MFPKEFFPDQREQVNLSPKKKLVNQTALTPSEGCPNFDPNSYSKTSYVGGKSHFLLISEIFTHVTNLTYE